MRKVKIKNKHYNVKNFPNRNVGLNKINSKIDTDFFLFLKLISSLFLFLILLPITIIAKIFFNKKIFKNPFEILAEIGEWFLQAKETSFLFFTLIITFIIQNILISIYSWETIKILFASNSQTFFQLSFLHTNFTSIFLHADIFHLSGNLLFLLIFGRLVEKTFQKKTILIFILSGILSNLISNYVAYNLGDYFFSIGASGAIAGFVIFGIILSPFSFSLIFLIPLPIFLIGWTSILLDFSNVLNPLSNINHLAHIGGYLSLIPLFFIFSLEHKKKIFFGILLNIILLVITYYIFKIYNLNILGI